MAREPRFGLDIMRETGLPSGTVHMTLLELELAGRLEEPIGRFPVSAVFHGHAHRGQADGHTSGNIPVFNVSAPLMREMFPDRPFRVVGRIAYEYERGFWSEWHLVFADGGTDALLRTDAWPAAWDLALG